jgi:hypothetical protein
LPSCWATATAVSQKPVTYSVGPNILHVTTADLNGDGKLDLAVVGDGSKSIGILLGNGDGTFRAGTSGTTGNGPTAVIAVDFNLSSLMPVRFFCRIPPLLPGEHLRLMKRFHRERRLAVQVLTKALQPGTVSE